MKGVMNYSRSMVSFLHEHNHGQVPTYSFHWYASNIHLDMKQSSLQSISHKGLLFSIKIPHIHNWLPIKYFYIWTVSINILFYTKLFPCTALTYQVYLISGHGLVCGRYYLSMHWTQHLFSLSIIPHCDMMLCGIIDLSDHWFKAMLIFAWKSD